MLDEAIFGFVEESKLLLSVLLELGVFENNGVFNGFDLLDLFGNGLFWLWFGLDFRLFFLFLLLLFFLFLFCLQVFLVLFVLFFLPFEGVGVDWLILLIGFAHFSNLKYI